MKFRWETEFKETEIGKIPKDWDVKQLGNGNFKIIMGQSPPSKYYNKEGVGFPFVQGKAEFGELYIKTNTYTTKCAKIAPAYSVLITVRAPVGELNITKEELCIGRGVAAILSKDNDTTKNKFIYYVLKGLKSYIEAFGDRGTTYDSITKDDLENLQIPYPLPEEQTRIATVLSWFDDLIENKRKQNEILEKTAIAIFKSWFIDFEPFQDEEFVYNEELDMEIPKGWDVKKLGSIVEFKYGKGLPERKRKPGPYPVVGSSGIVGYHSEYLVKGPTVIIGRKGNVGTVQLIIEPNYPIDTVFYSSPNTPKELVFYIYHYLKLNSPKDVASTDTAVPGLNINLLNLMDIVIPPQPILQRFHSLVEPLFQKILLNQKQILTLKKIRDTLLPQLVFGRLRVEEI